MSAKPEIRTRSLVAAALLCWSLIAAGLHADTPAADLELRVSQLLQRLQSPDATVSDAAERALLELGEPILPLLPAATQDPPNALAERLERIRGALRQRQASQLSRSSPLAIRGQMTLGELLREVQAQTGNRVLDQRSRLGQDSPDLRVSLDSATNAARGEFWPLMDGVLDAAQLTWYSTTGEPRALGLQTAPPDQASRAAEACYRGAFRLAIPSVAAVRSRRDAREAGLKLRLELLWEPKLSAIQVRHRLSDLTARDDTGVTLAMRDEGASVEVPVPPTVSGIEMTLPLPLPSRKASHLATIQGRLTVLALGPEESFEFADLTKTRATLERGAVAVTLDEVRRTPETLTCQIRLKLPASSPPLESHLDWPRRNVAYLQTEDGRRIEASTSERYLETAQEIGQTYLFPITPDLDRLQLVYRTPTTIAEVPINYEFTHIELP